ncbi:hypothetical protein ACHAXA_011896 [Cyclostephanos tholiformis]|uniref:Uncharacterized protein n=1 Tax=Cyclostephanos tholiformis TaxID=382380 RepID=A0ABD3SCT1_9STRA
MVTPLVFPHASNPLPRPGRRLSPPVPVLIHLPLLLLLLPKNAHAILPTAAIDVRLPGTSPSDVITLLASQASFGGPVARYDQRRPPPYSSPSDAPNGVGVVPAFPPDDDPYLCNESEGLADYATSSPPNGHPRTALLVPRGRCSFERKALSAQRLGSSIIVIYGTLSSRYSLNYTNSTPDAMIDDSRTRSGYTNDDVIWPLDKFDYDCDMGRAYLPREVYDELNFVKLPGGYDEANNDPLLTGSGGGNACGKSFVSGCESRRCLVTGRNVTRGVDGDGDDDDVTSYEACCAWDLHIWLYEDSAVARDKNNEGVTIPAVYITMEESSMLLDLVRGAGGGGSSDPIVITVYERPRPVYNASAILIWALGVLVAWISSHRSSADIRKLGKEILARREYKERTRERGWDMGGSVISGGHPSSSLASSSSTGQAYGGGGGDDDDDDVGYVERTIYRASDDDDVSSCAPNASAVAVAAQHRADRPQQQEETLELTAAHAVGFLVTASCSLLVLFFLKVYGIVKVMYAFGCSGAFAQMMVHPGLAYTCRKLGYVRPTSSVDCLSEANVAREMMRGGARGKCLGCLYSFFGPISPLDVVAMVVSYGVGAAWLWIGFAIPHPGNVAFYWIVQDVFGLCMCMLFLETIKLNSIKVGAILLIVAFFYDIFFVFITPMLTKHGESIMVNVATSGGPPKADPAWCEKYPFDINCKGGDPLPMLFAIPRIGDYQGGSSMLGLGDIVLPGLLLSFASRFDESKRLMGMVSGGSGRIVANNACPAGAAQRRDGGSANPLCFLRSCCYGRGYYFPVMVGYAIGLFMANAAVYIMEMGQPALLYLVPCCLGTMVYMGRRAGELGDLWEGPRAIRAADALMYGEAHVESAAAAAEQDLALEESTRNNEAEMT